jgi:hypothetical protein
MRIRWPKGPHKPPQTATNRHKPPQTMTNTQTIRPTSLRQQITRTSAPILLRLPTPLTLPRQMMVVIHLGSMPTTLRMRAVRPLLRDTTCAALQRRRYPTQPAFRPRITFCILRLPLSFEGYRIHRRESPRQGRVQRLPLLLGQHRVPLPISRQQ